MKKAILFDADGTLLEVPNPYLVIAEALGCKDEVKKLVVEYLNAPDQSDEIYKKLCEDELEIFNRVFCEKNGRYPTAQDFNDLMPAPTIKEGIKEMIEKLHSLGIEVHVISSGFMHMVKNLESIGIPMQNLNANSFVDGVDGKVKLDIKVFGNKVKSVESVIESRGLSYENVRYVGNDKFDIPIIEFMLSKKGSAFIVLNEAEPFPLPENMLHLPSIKDLNDLPNIIDFEEKLLDSGTIN